MRTGMITEITGEPAAAKSQICMQLLLTVQLPRHLGGLEASALYIYTEGDPPLRRLRAMAEHKHSQGVGLGAAAMDHIFVQKPTTPEELLSVLAQARPLLEHPPGRPVRLIVLDSVANIFRDLGDTPGVSELAERADLLFKISKILKSYADEYKLAVVIINQVTDVIGMEGVNHVGPEAGRLVSSGRRVAPALGLAWSHCVNTRLFASRSEGGGSARGPTRSLQVVFSPYLPPHRCFYEVYDGGVRAVAPPSTPAMSAPLVAPGAAAPLAGIPAPAAATPAASAAAPSAPAGASGSMPAIASSSVSAAGTAPMATVVAAPPAGA